MRAGFHGATREIMIRYKFGVDYWTYFTAWRFCFTGDNESLVKIHFPSLKMLWLDARGD